MIAWIFPKQNKKKPIFFFLIAYKLNYASKQYFKSSERFEYRLELKISIINLDLIATFNLCVGEKNDFDATPI